MTFDSILAATIERSAPAQIVSENHNGDMLCANLAIRSGKVNLVCVNKVPWHGLGVIVDKAMSAAEACRLASLNNWQLQKVQQTANINGAVIECTGQFAIIRGDTSAYLGSVGSRYEIVANEVCFDFMDALLGTGVRYETAGALGAGERIWMLARMPETIRVNIGTREDTSETYVILTSAHDGSDQISVYPTTVRTVCQNTYRQAQNQRNGGTIKIKHTASAKTKMQAAQRVAEVTSEGFKYFAEVAQTMADTRIEPAEYFQACLDDIVDVSVIGQSVNSESIRNGSVLKSILAITDVDNQDAEKRRYDKALSRRAEALEDILERHESESNGGAQGTVWGGFNAITDFADHSSLIRQHGEGRSKAEATFVSSFDGRRDAIKQFAFARATALLN